jgi:hypothetical protein
MDIIQVDRLRECLKNKLNDKRQTEKSKSHKQPDLEWKTELFTNILQSVREIQNEWKKRSPGALREDVEKIADEIQNNNKGFEILERLIDENFPTPRDKEWLLMKDRERQRLVTDEG